ncbi:MAG: hydrolase [Desulfuromonas sp.]|nr:MAG: hydrolase [Desulfuromonas sp.]
MADKTDLEFLEQLIAAPSPSGYEAPVRALLKQVLAPLADSCETDMMGNLILRLAGSGNGKPRVMLTAHCDEIGFLIKHIDDNGFVRFSAIGGVDPHIVPGHRVHVVTGNGLVPGVVGRKPIHLLDAKDKERISPITEQFIDIGCSSKEEAEAVAAVGDPVVFVDGLQRLQGKRLAARAFDDKVGVFAVAQAFRQLATGPRPDAEVVALFSVQEELGLRGAVTGTYGVRPDIALAIEIGHASDTPGSEPHLVGEVKLGNGPAISRGPNINHQLFALLQEVARRNGIPLQIVGEQRATSTDANVVQLSRRGVATSLLRVPTRYVHTPSEVVDFSDVQQVVDLLVATVAEIRQRDDFLPE